MRPHPRLREEEQVWEVEREKKEDFAVIHII